MLEQLIGNIYQTNSQLPLAYGGMYANAYSPYFQYMGNQAGNMAGLGNTYLGQAGQMGQASMGLYGQLAGQQAQMYQTELPIQYEMQKFNALSPVLSGLLGQGGFDGLPSIGPVNMSFSRPDVMAGYQGAVDRGYAGVKDAYGAATSGVRSYDGQFAGGFADMLDKLPAAPYARATKPAPAAASPAPTPSAGGQRFAGRMPVYHTASMRR